MLPSMPGAKSCVFANRLVAYHETFAPLGDQRKKKHVKQVMSIRWHEDISGRSAADVTSAFRKAISMMAEDAKHIVIWCDNCPAQNKNWTLHTSLTRYMNSNAVVKSQGIQCTCIVIDLTWVLSGCSSIELHASSFPRELENGKRYSVRICPIRLPASRVKTRELGKCACSLFADT